MKLLFVTCLREFKHDVTKIFHESAIRVFSITETQGIKDEHDINLLQDWFGSKDGEYDSLILFSFTAESSAQKAMELIKDHNANNGNQFPIRAFILPVEESNYSA